MAEATDIILSPVQQLADSWQARILRETCEEKWMGAVAPKNRIGAVVLSVFAHGLDAGALAILLKGIFPGFYSIAAPFCCSAAKIDKRGYVVVDMVLRDNAPVRKNTIAFYSSLDMETVFRRLADRCRLDDTERLKLFAAARAWVVADRRLDPTMNPADPDARRLVLH